MSSEHYKQDILTIAIVSTTVCILFIPTYIYGLLKWKQFQYHILIKKRFPELSITVSIASLLVSILASIARWIQYKNFENELLLTISASMSYFTYNLISIRLFLVYLRFKQSKIKQEETKTIYEQSEISTSNTISALETESVSQSRNKKQKSIYNHWFIISLLLFAFIIAIYTSFSDSSSIQWLMIFGLGWIVNFIVTIVIVLIVICSKTKDGIGCKKETFIIICWRLVMFFIGGLQQQIPQAVLPVAYILSVGALISGLVPLYAGLYYIYHFEGSLNYENWKNKELPKSVDEETRGSIINVVNTGDMLSKIDKLSICVFLDSDYKNCKAFKEYLTHCWSLENLLFVERVSIIHQLILKYKLLSNEKQSDDANAQQRIRLKFVYIKSMYAQYQKIINKEINKEEDNKSNDFETLKKSFNKIYVNIFEEFIQNGAINEINISFETRNALSFVLKESVNMGKLVSFNDYLYLFDDAFIEIYQLLSSMYTFQFKKYVQSHAV
eukprot:527227_1